MARKRSGPAIVWRNGRAYGDFRSYHDVGGGREALTPPNSSWATTDSEIAEDLFQARWKELREKRKGGITGKLEKRTTLDQLIRDHLKKKSKAGRTSHSHMVDLEQRLTAAMQFFGAKRDPRTIEPDEVRDWAEALAADGKRKPGTVRHYLNALSGLYGRAIEGLYVPPHYNPVAMLGEKPTGKWGSGDAKYLEVADAALLLEAARVLEQRDRINATAGFHAIVATFLLTGGRKAEVLGLDVEDVSFDREEVRFRPNTHRGLKTGTSHRAVPLWPQLREILQQWMYGGDVPRTQGLLFPASHGGKVTDLRKSLDAIGAMCGFGEGEVRTRRFRHTYCSARLQTVQRIVKPGKDPATHPEPYEWVEVSRFDVQKEMGHGGATLVDRIYGHRSRNPYRSEVVEYRVENHSKELGERLVALRAAASV